MPIKKCNIKTGCPATRLYCCPSFNVDRISTGSVYILLKTLITTKLKVGLCRCICYLLWVSNSDVTGASYVTSYLLLSVVPSLSITYLLPSVVPSIYSFLDYIDGNLYLRLIVKAKFLQLLLRIKHYYIKHDVFHRQRGELDNERAPEADNQEQQQVTRVIESLNKGKILIHY